MILNDMFVQQKSEFVVPIRMTVMSLPRAQTPDLELTVVNAMKAMRVMERLNVNVSIMAQYCLFHLIGLWLISKTYHYTSCYRKNYLSEKLVIYREERGVFDYLLLNSMTAKRFEIFYPTITKMHHR